MDALVQPLLQFRRMAAASYPAPRVTCPKCHGHAVQATLKTDFGSYYLCDRCGHLWHQDEFPKAAAS
jgi:DNA-directed RNA polymerase subunit M/transcription elongation factor TFIIS